MRARYLFVILAACILFLSGSVLFKPFGDLMEQHSAWLPIVAGLLPVALIIWLYISLVRPMTTLSNGMDLLSAQDFSSRLAPVGQVDADHLVNMFNKMMSNLKTERLRVKEQNHFLHLLIEASPLGIVILNFDGLISEINPAMARMLGVDDAASLRGCRLEEVPGELAMKLARIPQGEKQTLRLGDTMVVRGQRLSFMESGFARPYIIAEPMTDEVMRAEKEAYGKVIRLLAHEVNNTMGGLNSVLQTLADVMEGDPANADLLPALDSCRDRCASLGRFITSYANVVKIPDAVLRRVELNSLVRSLSPFLESLSGETTRVVVECDQEPVYVDADVVLMEQVLVNVVKNSVESIGGAPGGCVTIRVSRELNGLTVTDNGAGISDEAAEKLFTPFYSTKRGGQGLGLMFVSEILRRHNCRFSLRTIDDVTRFSVSFPACRIA